MQHAHDQARIPLAIIGMACRLPGANNLDEFWSLVSEGKSAIREVPRDRFDMDLIYDPRAEELGTTSTRVAGLVEAPQGVNSGDHPLPPGADPAHRAMFEVARAACEHAGLDPFNLRPRNTGVYIGHDWGSSAWGDTVCRERAEEIAELIRTASPDIVSPEIFSEFATEFRRRIPEHHPDARHTAADKVAGTIRELLDLNGPAIALDSACASSLHAMLVAGRALQLGRIEMAIVGGASTCRSETFIEFTRVGASSTTGSRPFDADADGVICSEGYVAVVMKTLSRALADGDEILAVVRGMGVSSDGRGKGIWAPQSEGQVRAIERAYADSESMSRVQYIEAHATSTPLGDATELASLAAAFGGRLPPGKKIAVTSLKANIGHTLETAGVAGVIKTILCLRHRLFPPAINVNSLNRNFDWDSAPVAIPRQLGPWPAQEDGSPRRAGINAFGLGGLNMHVVLDEFLPAVNRANGGIWAFSAFSDDRSQENAQQLAVIGRGFTTAHHEILDTLSGLFDTTEFDCQPQPFEYDWKRHRIPPKQVERANCRDLMVLDAADRALSEAGFDRRPVDRTRVGVIVGAEFKNDFAADLLFGWKIALIRQTLRTILRPRGLPEQEIEAAIRRFSESLLQRCPGILDDTGGFQSSSAASRVARTWNLGAGAATIDCGRDSGQAAFAIAMDQLLAGDCDVMVCITGQFRSGMIAESRPDAPNPRVMGAAAVVLKRLEDAQRDADTILRVIPGHSDPRSTAMTIDAYFDAASILA